MTPSENLIAFRTILIKETLRFSRIWIQTILPPAITTALYFVIFGNLIGSQIGSVGGKPYMEYLVPGLIMMAVITNSYANVVSSFFSSKFQHSIEEMLVSPIPNSLIIWGFVAGGVARGMSVGLAVSLVSMFFSNIEVSHGLVAVSMLVLTSVLFSLAGLINGIFAKSFDDISIVPTFVLTPLTYLGGIFYSIDMLPEFWRQVSLANPILYMINAFRFGVLGVSDINLYLSYVIVAAAIAGLFATGLFLLRRGYGVRT
jgi:ABC-2 type transport system permease protein